MISKKLQQNIPEIRLFPDPAMTIFCTFYFHRLEEKISEAQQRAIEQADADSLGTSLGELDDSSRMSMPSSEPLIMPTGTTATI